MREQEIAKIKWKNVVDMALTFTAMMRIFAKNSKEPIANKLGDLCSNIASVKSAEEYENLHRAFCDWFVREIKTVEKIDKKTKETIKSTGPTSYGQAAKILDIVMKVYVYYCCQPTIDDSQRLLPLLHGAVDTKIMRFLKAKWPDSEIMAKSIEQVNRQTYAAL
jgi:hypothetical protein